MKDSSTSTTGTFPVLSRYISLTWDSQEDILQSYARKYGFDYSIIRPNNIIGTAAGNYMNEAIAIGLYIAVSKALGGPVLFPGTRNPPASQFQSPN